MENAVKRIGVLTSGGDAPGMNAAIRAVVRSALSRGIEVVGIRRGWQGLINGDFVQMDSSSVSRIINRGGTILYTARSDEFRTKAGQEKAYNTCKLLGLDGIVAIGGDGTFRGAQDLSKWGISEVEVMGHRAGYLALYVGLAVGATAVLVPETEYDFEAHVAEKIRQARLMGKTNFMIVVAEGCVSAMKVGEQIKSELGLDPRVTILGHIQRGGSPTAKDRVIATRMGYEAVRVLAEGGTNRVIVIHSDQVSDLDIDEGLAMMKTLNQEEFQVMKTMTGQ